MIFWWFSACVLVARLDFHSYYILYVIDKDNSPPIKNWGSGTFLRFAGQLDRQRSRYSRHIDCCQIYDIFYNIFYTFIREHFNSFSHTPRNHEWPQSRHVLYANPHIASWPIASVIFLNPNFVTVKVLTEEWENDWPFQNDLVQIHKAATSNPLAPQEFVPGPNRVAYRLWFVVQAGSTKLQPLKEDTDRKIILERFLEEMCMLRPSVPVVLGSRWHWSRSGNSRTMMLFSRLGCAPTERHLPELGQSLSEGYTPSGIAVYVLTSGGDIPDPSVPPRRQICSRVPGFPY